MKPICFIAARGGSKGVSKKNIKMLNGKPLIAHTIEKAKKSKLFSDIIVSTEDKEISQISKKYGATIPFMRPKYLATDSSTILDVLQYSIKKLIELDYNFDTFVLLDCTVPFIRINDIKKTIQILKKKNAVLVGGVYKQHLNPYYNIAEINSNGFLKLVKQTKKRPKSRQKAPIVYQLNGLYTFNVKKFLKLGKNVFQKMIPFEIPIETGLMIDTEFEFKIAELLIKNKHN